MNMATTLSNSSRRLWLAWYFGSLACVLSTRLHAAGSEEPANQLLVRCLDGPNSAAAHAADAAVGATVIRRYEALGWYLVRLPDELNVDDGEARYRRQPGVQKVEPNRRLNPHFSPPPPRPVEQLPNSEPTPTRDARPAATKPVDTKYNSQWNLKAIGMEAAWDITTGSTNVVVAVIDTGVNYRHPDLAANMWRNPGETGLDAQGRDKATNGIDDDGNGYIDDVFGIDSIAGTGDPMDRGFIAPPRIVNPFYHGTACAGIIGAVGNNALGIAGINWQVKIMALADAYGDQSIPQANSYVSHHLASYDYVLTMKRRGENIRVTSHSYLLGIISVAVEDAFRLMAQEGILAVFPAGNDGENSDQTWWRWSMIDNPNILAVTGIDRSGQQIYDFGRTTTDLAAPTTEITTLTIGTNYITDFNGTSAAYPHVSGAAALLCAAKPDITVDELKAALFGSVDILSSLRGKTRTNGRLNVGRALQSLTNADPVAIVIYAAPGNLRTEALAPIEVTFNQPMDRASVEGAFRLVPPLAGTFEWSADGRTFTFRHTEPFQRTSYTATILAAASDLKGGTLDGNFDRTRQASPQDDYVWTFSFATANDDLANAQLLDGPEGSVTGSNEHAVDEFGAPNALIQADFGLGATLWYRWTAPNSGWVTFDLTQKIGFDTTLGIY